MKNLCLITRIAKARIPVPFTARTHLTRTQFQIIHGIHINAIAHIDNWQLNFQFDRAENVTEPLKN